MASPKTFQLIGHRGFPAMAPENTLSSIDLAIEAEADMIEIDVSFTRDKKIVVIHDDTLQRTTNGKGKVRDMNWSVIEKLDAGSWFSEEFEGEGVPLLKDVLEKVALSQMPLNIEIKSESVGSELSGGIEEQVLEMVRREYQLKQVVFSSFSSLAVRRIKQLEPHSSSALILEHELSQDPMYLIQDLSIDAIHMNQKKTTSSHVEVCKQAGLTVRCYTVNDPRRMQDLRNMGVDGIFTDDLSLMKAAIS
ncbi:MAG: glycerophosphodiester phosphodiesterase family protein [Bdellovibrionota bacterium]